MHKRLLILGMLLQGPLTGYDLHRIVAAHGELYRDLKRPNLYYLLERMSVEGLVRMKAEAGARGPRGERLVYSITKSGRAKVIELLREVLVSYEPVHSSVDVALVLLDQLPRQEAASLLKQRLETVSSRRDQVARELGSAGQEAGSAGDHLLSFIDAEVHWLRRAVKRVGAGGRSARHQ